MSTALKRRRASVGTHSVSLDFPGATDALIKIK